MKRHNSVGFGALAALLAAAQLLAQCDDTCLSGSGPIKIGIGTIDDSTVGETVVMCEPDATDFTIDLTALGVADWTADFGQWTLHIFDCGDGSGNPTHSIGRVTITGAPSGLVKLAVLVAGSNDVWPGVNRIHLTPGSVDFGGLVVDDSDTLSKTEAAIAVTDTIEHRGTDPDAVDVPGREKRSRTP